MLQEITAETGTLRTLDDLREFIHNQLCEKENLLAEQFRLRELALMQGDKVLGLQFSVRGPRQILLGAIWTTDLNQVFFYDTRGERYLKLQLSQRIPLPEPVEIKQAG